MEKIHVDWKFVDTQADLDFFGPSFYWHDSELLEFCGTRQEGDYFPHDVSRSGYLHLHLHALYEVYAAPGRYLHLVLICCEHYNSIVLQHGPWQGRVDTLKRVEIYGWKNSLEMRCARMIYRFLSEEEVLPNQPYLCRFLAPPEY